MTPDVSPDRVLHLQGTYAGFVTRFGAFVIDVITIAALFALAGHVVEYLVSVLTGDPFDLSDHRIVATLLLLAWVLFYCAYPLAVAGRTFGMAVVGLQAVGTEGHRLTGRQAVLRVVVFPLSFLLLGFGFLLILLRRDRRALHDLIAKSAVIYAWDARAARLRFLARRDSSA